METIKGLVIKSYKTPYPDGIKLQKGDLVDVEKKETEWEGWMWCIKAKNISGWAPENILKITDNQARVLEDYDATELSVTEGEEIEILKEESDWYWCKNQKGNLGWAHKDNVKLL